MADTIDHSHGSTGAQPPDGLDFANGEFPDPEIFDWFWNEAVTTVNSHADQLDAIDSDGDGKVDQAEVADSATSYKNNDIDSDGDGKVDAADVADSATSYKDNDIDSDGDGKVDAADQADNATNVKGNDIDSDGDGKVDSAEEADELTTTRTISNEYVVESGGDYDTDDDGTSFASATIEESLAPNESFAIESYSASASTSHDGSDARDNCNVSVTVKLGGSTIASDSDSSTFDTGVSVSDTKPTLVVDGGEDLVLEGEAEWTDRNQADPYISEVNLSYEGRILRIE